MSSTTPYNGQHHNHNNGSEENLELLLHKAQQEDVTFTEFDLLRTLPDYKPNPYNPLLSIIERKEFLMSVFSILAMVGAASYLMWSPQQIVQPNINVATQQHVAVTKQEVQQPYIESLQKDKPKNVHIETVSTADTISVKVYEFKMLPDSAKNSALRLEPTGYSDSRIQVLNSWYPDSSTLTKLGFTVYGKDSIIHTVIQKLGEYGFYRFENSLYGKGEERKYKTYVVKEDNLPPVRSSIQPVYIVSERGDVLSFNEKAVGLSMQLEIFKKAFKKYGNDSLQKELDLFREKAYRLGCMFGQGTHYTVNDSIKFTTLISNFNSSNTNDNKYAVARFSIPKKEHQELMNEYVEKLSSTRNLYRDSCVAICIKPDGVHPLYVLYYPSPEFLSLLPKNVVLQIRAEQGNEEALRELKANYKGCRLMTHCKSSDGAIEETEIRGSGSSSVQLYMSLNAPRTLRVALYDIRGNLLSEVVQQKEFAQGEYQIPIPYNMNSENSMFALLVITTDRGEKVVQRVILEK